MQLLSQYDWWQQPVGWSLRLFYLTQTSAIGLPKLQIPLPLC
jgi:hypothetical protein